MRAQVTATLGCLLLACGEREPCPAPGTDEGLVARLDVALALCNLAPSVAVGGGRLVSKGQTLELDAATRTTDPNGDALVYRWSITSRPAASTSALETPRPGQLRLFIDAVGTYVLALEVSDGELTTTAPPIVVTAQNDAPVAAAGGDLSIAFGERAVLNGAGSTDANGDRLTYAWTFVSQPATSRAIIPSASSATTSFVPDARGPYEIMLTVSDGELSSTDTLTLRAGISANMPVARATTRSTTVAVGDVVTLDGGGSSDADGDPIAYHWQLAARPPRSEVVLADPTARTLSFIADQPGEFRVVLVVDDGYHSSAAAPVTVTAIGDPRIRCDGVVPFARNATLAGSTTGQGNDYETGCGSSGADDVVLEFVAPGDLDDLEVSLGAGFPGVAAVYFDDCGPAARQQCVSAGTSGSLGRVPAGTKVDIIVDGSSAGSAGDYEVSLRGRLASDQPCSPGDTSFTCDLGECSPTPRGTRCPAILDCPDGVDVDRDGRTDEDMCSSPPVLTCPPDQVVDVLATSEISATHTSTSPILRRRWTVEDEPLGSALAPSPRESATTRVRPLLYGDYRLRYTEIDSDLESSSCETVLSAGTRDALRVELIWNPTIPEELHASDVDLHLLHPDATAWFSSLDCYYANSRPDWDSASVTDDDPRLDLDDVSGRGPENINILAPGEGRSYRVGVHYFSDHGYGPAAVYVNVYCYNRLSQRFGPVTLANSQFWKIADVRVDATSCQVTSLAQGNMPLVVPSSEAHSSR